MISVDTVRFTFRARQRAKFDDAVDFDDGDREGDGWRIIYCREIF